MDRKFVIIVSSLLGFGFTLSLLSVIPLMFNHNMGIAILRILITSTIFSLLGAFLYFIFKSFMPEIFDLPIFSDDGLSSISSGLSSLTPQGAGKKGGKKLADDLDYSDDFLDDDSFLDDDDDKNKKQKSNSPYDVDDLFKLTAEDVNVDLDNVGDLDDGFGFFSDGEEDGEDSADSGAKEALAYKPKRNRSDFDDDAPTESINDKFKGSDDEEESSKSYKSSENKTDFTKTQAEDLAKGIRTILEKDR